MPRGEVRPPMASHKTKSAHVQVSNGKREAEVRPQQYKEVAKHLVKSALG